MAALWFVCKPRGQQWGPIPATELRRLAEVGVVRPETLVRQADSGRWVRAEQVLGLFQRTAPPPSSPVGSPPVPPPLLSVVPESGAPSSGVGGGSTIRQGLGAATVNEAPEESERIWPVTWAAIFVGSGTVLLLLWAVVFRGGSAPQQETLEEKWPAAFSLESLERFRESSPPPDSFLPLWTKDEVSRLAAACSYDFFLKRSIAVLGLDFPEVKARLSSAQLGYERRFGPAIENIQRIATSHFPDLERQLTESCKGLEQQISSRNVNPEMLQTLVKEVENVGEGGVRSPVLETLLTYHPEYLRNPALEFLGGYKREYTTDGTGKSAGIQLRIEYPASWKARPGIRPHVLQKFSSQGGQEEVLLLIVELPAEFQDLSEGELSAADLQELAEESFSEMPGSTKVDSGHVRLAGSRAGWAEFEAQVNRVGMKIAQHGLSLALIHRGRFVNILLASLSAPDVEAVIEDGEARATAEQRFFRSAPLFQMMLNSLDFMDRYED